MPCDHFHGPSDPFAHHLRNMVFHLAGFKIPRSIRMLTQFGGDALLPSIVKGRLVHETTVYGTKELRSFTSILLFPCTDILRPLSQSELLPILERELLLRVHLESSSQTKVGSRLKG